MERVREREKERMKDKNVIDFCFTIFSSEIDIVTKKKKCDVFIMEVMFFPFEIQSLSLSFLNEEEKKSQNNQSFGLLSMNLNRLGIVIED